MLLELHVRNFALIDSIDLEFSQGLNILTGETGAGKSIIIDSVNFILGDKQNKDIIRTGANEAFVEAVFSPENDEIFKILEENGIESDDILVISREILSSGRSITRINGRTVTIGLLKQIGSLLIDIHGQHQHQSLLSDDKHILILDIFCGERLETLIISYKELFNQLKELEKEIESLVIDEDFKAKRIDLLSYQVNEISAANLVVGEDEELSKQRDILSNAERIFSALSLVYSKLYNGEEGNSAYDEIGTSIVSLESIERFDDNLREVKSSLEDVYYKLEGIVADVRDYKDGIDFSPDLLNQVEVRLDSINRLKMKYGKTIEEIKAYCEKSKIELENMENNDEIIEKLKKKKKEILLALNKHADDITSIRRETAEKLGGLIEKELKYLGMEKAKFVVNVDETETLRENGRNKVYFTMTANIGEPLRFLSRIASGGEISRVMLAIKTVIADIDNIPSLIFDEIDTGISGRTAQAVAEKMCLISKNHQILCVTHLPQIAAMADGHFKIEKITEEGKTFTKVDLLDKQGETDELARMLGGAVLTELTRKHAHEMKELANSLKSMIKN